MAAFLLFPGHISLGEGVGCTRARGGKLLARAAPSRPPARVAPLRLARPLPPASGEAIREGMLGLERCRGNPIPAWSGAQRLPARPNGRGDSGGAAAGPRG